VLSITPTLEKTGEREKAQVKGKRLMGKRRAE
jgi:hypothetical protein